MLGRRIREARLRKGLKVADVARALDTKWQAVQEWEQGKRMQGLTLALLLALGGCYASHVAPADAAAEAPACVELGPRGCLIDRPCWCFRADGGWTCRTCASSCAGACECVAVGGVPADRCE